MALRHGGDADLSALESSLYRNDMFLGGLRHRLDETAVSQDKISYRSIQDPVLLKPGIHYVNHIPVKTVVRAPVKIPVKVSTNTPISLHNRHNVTTTNLRLQNIRGSAGFKNVSISIGKADDVSRICSPPPFPSSPPLSPSPQTTPLSPTTSLPARHSGHACGAVHYGYCAPVSTVETSSQNGTSVVAPSRTSSTTLQTSLQTLPNTPQHIVQSRVVDLPSGRRVTKPKRHILRKVIQGIIQSYM